MVQVIAVLYLQSLESEDSLLAKYFLCGMSCAFKSLLKG